MHNLLIFIAGLSGALATGFGAMGAHFLKGRITPEQLHIYDKAVLYHFFHSIALLALVAVMSRVKSRALIVAGLSFMAGILFFSGSLYLLSLQTLLGIETWHFLGPLTPLGGIFFIIGWIMIGVSAFRT